MNPNRAPDTDSYNQEGYLRRLYEEVPAFIWSVAPDHSQLVV